LSEARDPGGGAQRLDLRVDPLPDLGADLDVAAKPVRSPSGSEGAKRGDQVVEVQGRATADLPQRPERLARVDGLRRPGDDQILRVRVDEDVLESRQAADAAELERQGPAALERPTRLREETRERHVEELRV